MTALIVGLLVGVTIGAVVVDILFTQPLARSYYRLESTCRRFKRQAERWERLATRQHPGTPYIQRAPLPAEHDRALVDGNDDHSKVAHLRGRVRSIAT